MDIRPTGNIGQSGASFEIRAAIQPESSSVTATAAAAPVQTVAAVQQPAPAPSAAQVTEALKEINKSLREQSQGVEFSVNEDDRTVVRVVDQETQEVIRQMPTKEALEIAKALDKLQGLLIRQKA